MVGLNGCPSDHFSQVLLSSSGLLWLMGLGLFGCLFWGFVLGWFLLSLFGWFGFFFLQTSLLRNSSFSHHPTGPWRAQSCWGRWFTPVDVSVSGAGETALKWK